MNRDKLHEWLMDESNRVQLLNLLFIVPLLGLLVIMPYIQAQLIGALGPSAGMKASQAFFFSIFILWFGGMYVMQKLQQAEAARCLAFPKSHWILGEESKTTEDLLVCEPPVELPHRDGERFYAYRVKWTPPVKLQGMGLVDEAIWLLPDRWEETFMFTPGLKVWKQAFVVPHPKAELVALHIPSEDSRLDYFGKNIPVAVVVNSSWHYRNGVKLPKINEQLVADYINKDLQQRLVAYGQTLATYKEYMDGLLKAYKGHEELVAKRIALIAQLEGTIRGTGMASRIVKKTFGSWKFWLALLVVLGILYHYGYIRVR